MTPLLISPQIHFDGWSHVYDFWIDADHPDIHPIGWCSKTGHPLQPPLSKSCTWLSPSWPGPKCARSPLSPSPAHAQKWPRDGQEGRAFLWSCQLENSSLSGAGREPIALALPGAAAMAVSLLFLLLV